MTTEQNLLFSTLNLILVGMGTIITNQAVLLTEAEANLVDNMPNLPFNNNYRARLDVMAKSQNNIATLNKELQKTSKQITKAQEIL